ncbi:melanotransferrin-like, partial [Scleropages formosus]
MDKCAAMSRSLSAAAVTPSVRCVAAESPTDCALKLRNNEVDAFSLSSKDIYTLGKETTFKIAAGESNSDGEGTVYYAVAVVRKDNEVISINNLKGRKSCHTGKGRTAGWNMPVGYLIDSGRMSVMSCNIAEGVADFFSASCIPGANETGDPSNLCQLCIGDETGQNKCASSDKERYFSYSGAFRCLAENTGEVAFVKHTTVMENTDGKLTCSGPQWIGPPHLQGALCDQYFHGTPAGNNPAAWAAGLSSQDFELLCPDGRRAAPLDYRRCNLARVPARGIVVGSGVNSLEVFNMLDEGRRHFNMFLSEPFGGKDLMFSDTSTHFILAESEDYKLWMGPRYFNNLRAMDCSSKGKCSDIPLQLRWCVLSHGELLKCADMAAAFKNRSLTPNIQYARFNQFGPVAPVVCVFVTVSLSLQNGDADAITLDGGFIYTAGKTYGLVPAAGESYT